MKSKRFDGPLERVNANCWRIPRSYKLGMRVDGLIFANAELIESIRDDLAPEQVANVAFLPGIQQASLAMPDIHWGYGFCIGGVCATDPEQQGVISMGICRLICLTLRKSPGFGRWMTLGGTCLHRRVI